QLAQSRVLVGHDPSIPHSPPLALARLLMIRCSMCRFRPAAAGLAAIGLTLLASPFARAGTALQAIVQVSGGYTDNVLSQPDKPPPGEIGPQPDSFFNLSPRLLFTYGQPGDIQRLGYTFSADLFATHSEANAYSHRGDWSAFFQTSRTTE